MASTAHASRGKNCSSSIVLTATDQKPQKSLAYYPPSHRLNVNVMLSNIIFLNDFFLRFLIRRR